MMDKRIRIPHCRIKDFIPRQVQLTRKLEADLHRYIVYLAPGLKLGRILTKRGTLCHD